MLWQNRENSHAFSFARFHIHLLSSGSPRRYTLTQQFSSIRNIIMRTRTPGISRIDQPAKRNHGFFVRLQRQGKTHSAFFTDQRHGGRKKALTAAQKHYRKLLAKFGPPLRRRRRWWAEIRRRKGSSSVVGVQKLAVRRHGEVRNFWVATWSPKLHVVRRKAFSFWKYGSKKARQLALRTRRAGLRTMQ
jgi:hypothetical protein